jgi:hypothetical protein
MFGGIIRCIITKRKKGVYVINLPIDEVFEKYASYSC